MAKKFLKRPYLNLMLFAVLILFCLNKTFAQGPPLPPQRTISVLPTQPIDFGIFYVTSAGTITVDWQGNISTTGGVVVVSSTNAKPAIFDVTLCQGRNVTISYNPTTTLTNGAPSLTLNVGDTEKGPSGSTFPVENNCNFITTLRVGGTLNVPAGAALGTYNGSFSINFTQE